MSNKDHLVKTDNLSEVISSEGFDKLTADDKHILVASMSNNIGLMEKLFGIDKEKIAMFIAFWLCIFLVAIGLVVWMMSHDLQIWNILIPTITTALGFACGKSSK